MLFDEEREGEPRVDSITMKTLKEQYGKLSSKQQEEWSPADMNLRALLTLDPTKVYGVKDLEDEMTLDRALRLLFAARYGQKKATSPDQMASSSSTSRVMMRINHQNFQLANVQARLNRLSPTDRYREQRVVAEQLLQLQDVIDDTIERYYQYVKKDEAWKVVTTKAAFETDFAAVKQVAKTRKQNRLEY